MSKSHGYMCLNFIFDGFTDSAEDDAMRQYIKDRFLQLYQKFNNAFNDNIDLWNAEYDHAYPGKDGWCREYSDYIFGKYQEVCRDLDKEIGDKYLELWPKLVKEDKDRAMYEGHMEPCFGIRLRNHPKKTMHVEWAPIIYNNLIDAMQAQEGVILC